MSLTKDELDAILRIAGIPTADEDREASRGQAYELGRADAVYSQARVMAEKVDGQVTAIREYAEGLEERLDDMVAPPCGWVAFQDRIAALERDHHHLAMTVLRLQGATVTEESRGSAPDRNDGGTGVQPGSTPGERSVTADWAGSNPASPTIPPEPAAPKEEDPCPECRDLVAYHFYAGGCACLGCRCKWVRPPLNLTPAPAPSESGERWCDVQPGMSRTCQHGTKGCVVDHPAPAGEAGKADRFTFRGHLGVDGRVRHCIENPCSVAPEAGHRTFIQLTPAVGEAGKARRGFLLLYRGPDKDQPFWVDGIELTPEVEAALAGAGKKCDEGLHGAALDVMLAKARADRAAVERLRGVLAEALECAEMRDKMNAAIHLTAVRWSPLTELLQDALRGEGEKP